MHKASGLQSLPFYFDFRAFQGGGFKLGSDTVASAAVSAENSTLGLFSSESKNIHQRMISVKVGVPGGAEANKPEERHFVLKM